MRFFESANYQFALQLALFDRQNRGFIREGSLQVATKEGEDDGKKKKFGEHHLFLFDDLLVDTVKKSDKLIFANKWNLAGMAVKYGGESGIPFPFAFVPSFSFSIF